MKDKKPLTWIPLFIDKHLFGSTRYELDPAERSVWIDLLAFSGKDNGHIRANEGVPYHLRQLAGIFNVPEDLLKQTIEKCIKYGKIKILKDDTMYLPSWENYRLSDRHIRRLKDTMSDKTDIMSDEPDAKSIEREEKERENRRVKINAEQEMQIHKLLINVKGIGEKQSTSVIHYIRELSIEFPDLDYVEEMQKKCSWWIDNPLNKKSNVHLQIRNWFAIAQKRIDESRSQDRVGSPNYLRKKTKNAEFEEHRKELEDYLRNEKKQSDDGIDYSDSDIRSIMNSAEMFYNRLKLEWYETDLKPEHFFKLLKRELEKRK